MATMFKRGGKGPWLIRWRNSSGRLQELSLGRADKATARTVKQEMEQRLVLEKQGLIDPRREHFRGENAKPIQAHVDAYLRHLDLKRGERRVADARRPLRSVIEASRAVRLTDVTLEVVENALALMKNDGSGPEGKGKAARTINHYAASVRAFMNWCVKENRLESNPLRHLVELNVDSDRRRERRPLTEEEVESLFAVAEPRGRKLWYMLAYYAGLRLGDLKRLRWKQVDLGGKVLQIPNGKAKRNDRVPLHPRLMAALERARPRDCLPSAAVFPSFPTNETRIKDFRRAGIAPTDDQDRVADLHSLRSSLATHLARKGVPAQILKQIMRHEDASTTEKFYVHFRDEDKASAIAKLTSGEGAEAAPHQNHHHSQRDEVLHRAT
jgi:integrase